MEKKKIKKKHCNLTMEKNRKCNESEKNLLLAIRRDENMRYKCIIRCSRILKIFTTGIRKRSQRTVKC